MRDLKEIGFYTLSNQRVYELINKQKCIKRGEIIVTNNCNFKCPYCRGLKDKYKELTLKQTLNILEKVKNMNIENIRFSGGEPTLWKLINKTVEICKNTIKTLDHIAVSTNGSAEKKIYKDLITNGVNDFSISLDGYTNYTINKMAGVKINKKQIIDNIKYCADKVYTTIGIVFNNDNIDEVYQLIKFSSEELGVSDIRIISTAQENINIPNHYILPESILSRHPILKYRINHTKNNRRLRGISINDSHKCFLVLDDIAIVDNYHYPCIIFLREKGSPIGRIDYKNIQQIQKERIKWSNSINTYIHPICKENCLDVCIEHNNKVKSEIKKKGGDLCKTNIAQ